MSTGLPQPAKPGHIQIEEQIARADAEEQQRVYKAIREYHRQIEVALLNNLGKVVVCTWIELTVEDRLDICERNGWQPEQVAWVHDTVFPRRELICYDTRGWESSQVIEVIRERLAARLQQPV